LRGLFYRAGALLLGALAVLGFLIAPTVAQQSSQDTVYAHALWVGKDGGLGKFSVSDGSSLLKITNIGKVRALAVDDKRSKVWVYAGSALRSYGFDGAPVAAVPVFAGGGDDGKDDDGDDDGDEDGSEHAYLDVSPRTGSVWLGVNKVVLRFGADGVLTGQMGLPDNVRAVSIDDSSGRIWVGTKKDVFAYDESGAQVLTLDLGDKPKVESLDFDNLSGVLWVVLKKSVRKHDSTGSLLLEVDIEKPRAVTGDGAGGAWIADHDDLLRLDGSGAVVLRVDPFDHDSKMDALALDHTDLSVWAASKKQIAHISRSGATLGIITLDSKGYDIEIYADATPPEVSITSPAAGSHINDPRPDIEITWNDEGSGVDPETLVINLNGAELETTCDKRNDGATCSPVSDIPDGEVTVSVTIGDRAGNVSEPAEVIFTIDTIPPVITLTSPPDELITNQPSQAFTGQLSEQADLTLMMTSTVGGSTVIDSYPVTVNTDLTFSHGVTLNEGSNDFTLEAVDLAGNVGVISLAATLDTVAPNPVDTDGVTISAPENGQVTVTGGPGSAEANVSVVVTNTRTGASVTVQAGDDGSFTAVIAAEGGDALSIVLNDAAGNGSAPAEVEVAIEGELNPSAIDKTVATTMFDATSFLFTGANPVQTGVADGTIEPRRVAVLRGTVSRCPGSRSLY